MRFVALVTAAAVLAVATCAPARDGLPAVVGNQGISHGWADQYFKHLGGQYFVLDGGDRRRATPGSGAHFPQRLFVRLTSGYICFGSTTTPTTGLAVLTRAVALLPRFHNSIG